MAILNKNALAGYFLKSYQDKYNRKVSPIKFQKGMYFLFAYWAQFSSKLKEFSEEGVSESVKLDLNLFDADFEAWQYGPVDRELYRAYNDNSIHYVDSEQLFSNVDVHVADTVASFVDDFLTQIYDINDFSLVDISHEDSIWKDTYDAHPNGDGKMNANEIVKEYTMRA